MTKKKRVYESREQVLEEIIRAVAAVKWPNFSGAVLEYYMDLSGINFHEAILDEADLTGADLRGADLTGVSLEETVLTETLGLVSIVGIGSRNDTLFAWRKKGPRGGNVYVFKTGCFEDDETAFRQAIKRKEEQQYVEGRYAQHAKVYRAAIPLMKAILDCHYRGFDG